MRAFTMVDLFRDRHQSKRMAVLNLIVAGVFVASLTGIILKAMFVSLPGITLIPGPELTAIEQADLELPRLENPRREYSHVNESWLV